MSGHQILILHVKLCLENSLICSLSNCFIQSSNVKVWFAQPCTILLDVTIVLAFPPQIFLTKLNPKFVKMFEVNQIPSALITWTNSI